MNDNTPAVFDPRKPLSSPKALAAVLEQEDRKAELAALLEETGISPERFIRTVVHAVAKSPDVMKCSGSSILLAVLDAARMGLEPTGQYGGAYLIRRGSEAVMEVDWRGFIRLGTRSGAIKRATSSPVYAGDMFEWEEGTSPRLFHRPTQGPARGDQERGELTHVYAIAWLPDGTPQFRVMTRDEVNAIMARTSSKQSGKVVGPWVSDYIAMALKTVVRQLFKFIPAVYNPALQYALEREDELAPLTTESTEDTARRPESRRDTIVAALTGESSPEELPAEPGTMGAVEDEPAPAPELPADDPELPDIPEESAPKRRRPARG